MIIFLLFICFWLGISFSRQIIIFSIVAVILLFIIFYKYKKKIGLLAAGIIALGVGISYIKFDFQRTDFSGLVVDSHPNYFIVLSKGERLYTYSKDNEYEIGDYLKITGEKKELDFAIIESGFDFKKYLHDKGVYYEIKAKSIETSFSNPIRIKARREKFLSHFDESSQSLIRALLFSEHDDSVTLGNMSKLHLGRLMNASGIFLYAYLHFFSFILSYFIKNKRIKIVALLTLVPYSIFTFPRLTVIRIFLLEILKFVNKTLLKKRFSYFQIVGAVGTTLLLVDYHLGYQMSFILGFSTPFIMMAIREAARWFKRWKKKLITLLFFYIFFIPFELKFYNGTNPLSLITQTVLAPLFIFLAVLSLLCFYGVPLYGVVGFLTKGAGNLLGWLAKISFQFNSPSFPGWLILLFALAFIAFCYYKSINFKPIYRVVMIFGLSIIIIHHIPFKNFITAEVSFINVGQGDACLIRKGTTSILIDTGGSTYQDIAQECLIPYFQKKRIYNIDLLITTHDDFDHSGGADSLKENFYVKRYVKDPDVFPININGITLKNYNTHITEYSGENDKSLVVGFTLMNKSFLIMGDAPTNVEKNIIKEYPNLDCDILKAGHHGSKTSTCDEFVKFVTPEEAIISCGVRNKYGHPHKEVITILNNNNVKIRRTDVEGTITYSNYIFM